MMPGMSGIDLLKKIKADPKLKHLMVILQTASVGTAEMIEGIQAGAYYYVTKPYAAELLLSIVRSAAHDFLEMERLRDQVTHNTRILDVTEICHFSLRTPEEAHMLALHLASFFKDTLVVCTGLSALIENAIEHGNLNIGIDNKREWLTHGTWEKEFRARLNAPENAGKKVMVSFQKLPEAARILISDEGEGFHSSSFQQLDPSRLTSPNGRGIAIASMAKEYTIEYLGNGSKVCMTVPIA
jgi:signal transduction histidine kinase